MKDTDDIRRRIAERTVILRAQKKVEDAQTAQTHLVEMKKKEQSRKEANAKYAGVIPQISQMIDDPELNLLLEELRKRYFNPITREEIRYRRGLFGGQIKERYELPVQIRIQKFYPKITEKFTAANNYPSGRKFDDYFLSEGSISIGPEDNSYKCIEIVILFDDDTQAIKMILNGYKLGAHNHPINLADVKERIIQAVAKFDVDGPGNENDDGVDERLGIYFGNDSVFD